MRWLSAFTTLFFAFPALADTPSAGAAAPDTAIAHSIWQLDSAGNATHVETRWQCPASFGDWRRHDLHAYDAYGLDVSCDYLGPDGDITLYLTKRTGGDLAADLKADEDALTGRISGAVPAAAQTSFASDRDWSYKLYTSQNGAQTDGVWLAWYGDWQFEVRATYRSAESDAALTQIATMTSAAHAAGEHLARCAHSTVPARGGAAVTDNDKLMQLTMMATIASAGASLDTGKVPPPAPMEWCAEAGYAANNTTPVLLWHAIAGDGTMLPHDRAMLMTIGEPPYLESAPNPTLNTILGELNQAGPETFVVTMADGDRTVLYGFYQGRPDGAELARILAAIKDGHARAFGAYDSKTKNITIVTPPK